MNAENKIIVYAVAIGGLAIGLGALNDLLYKRTHAVAVEDTVIVGCYDNAVDYRDAIADTSANSTGCLTNLQVFGDDYRTVNNFCADMHKKRKDNCTIDDLNGLIKQDQDAMNSAGQYLKLYETNLIKIAAEMKKLTAQKKKKYGI